MAQTKVQVVISAIDKASAVIRNVKDEIDRLGRSGGGRGRGGSGNGYGVPNGYPVGPSRPGRAPRAPRVPGAGPVPNYPHAPHAPAGVTGPGAVNSGAGFAPFGFTPGMMAGIGGAIGGKEIIRTAADFETQMTNIQKKTGATNAEMAKLREQILNMATNGKMAASLEEIGAAFERGGAAGISLDKLQEFARVSAMAADAFEMSAADVGNAAAGFNVVQGIKMEDMERYFDLINSLADSGIADESGIIAYIDQGGAIAKMFGLAANEVAALGSAMANLKIGAFKGATATNSIFNKLLAPGGLSEDGIKAYNQLFNNDDSKFRNMLKTGKSAEALMDVLDRFAAMDVEKRMGIMYELFGADHMDVMAQLVAGSAEVRENFALAATGNWAGSLGRSYALKLDDFWSQWEIFKNELKRTAIDGATFGLPALISGLQAAGRLARDIGTGLKEFQLDLDRQSIDDAVRAMGEARDALGELLGIKTSDSEITRFFREFADAVNDVADGINAIKAGIQIIGESAMGQYLFGDAKDRAEAAQRMGADINENGGLTKVPIKPGGLFPGLTEELARRSGTPMADPDASQAQRDKTGRARETPDSIIGNRFGDANGGNMQGLAEYMARRAAQQPAAPDLGPNLGTTTGVIPVPTPRPDVAALREAVNLTQTLNAMPPPTVDLDNTAFLQKAGEAQAARDGLNTPVVATADLNIGPALAKINTLKTALAEVNNMKVTAGGGGGDYGSNVRGQFAPVGAG